MTEDECTRVTLYDGDRSGTTLALVTFVRDDGAHRFEVQYRVPGQPTIVGAMAWFMHRAGKAHALAEEHVAEVERVARALGWGDRPAGLARAPMDRASQERE